MTEDGLAGEAKACIRRLACLEDRLGWPGSPTVRWFQRVAVRGALDRLAGMTGDERRAIA